MDPAVLSILLAVASLTVLVGGGSAVCGRLLESTRRGRLRTWIAVALQFLFGVASLVAVLVPIMLASDRVAHATPRPFEPLVNATLIIAATTTTAAIGTLLWSGYRRKHPRRVRRSARSAR